MINPMNLTGKTIFITGASSGIGKETAIQCSKLGANVIITARREEKLIETCQKMEGSNNKYYPFDLSNIDEISDLVKKIISENGALDGFVHCAGIAANRPLKMLKNTNFIEIINLNLGSFIEFVRTITLKGHINNGASIVGVSSVASIVGNKAKISYCASKAGMDAAIKCLAHELSEKKVRVNTIQPGWVNTEMLQKYSDLHGSSNYAKNQIERQFLGISEPLEIANLISFLLSDATKTLTGTSIRIDGGFLA